MTRPTPLIPITATSITSSVGGLNPVAVDVRQANSLTPKRPNRTPPLSPVAVGQLRRWPG